MPRLRARRSTALLEGRAALRRLMAPGPTQPVPWNDATYYTPGVAPVPAPLPAALRGAYAHGEAYGSAWGAELESTVCVSLPDLRPEARGARTIILITHGFDNGCGPDCGCARSDFAVVDALLAEDDAFRTLLAFELDGGNEYGYAGPWCTPLDDAAYLERFVAACGVALTDAGPMVRALCQIDGKNTWKHLRRNYSDKVRKGIEAVMRDYPNINFGRPGQTDTGHLEADAAPRRRLIEFCTALPAISRSSLVRLAGALRTACAECTYKMEPPEPGSDDEFDQFDY